jgi:hypothetical protein
MSRACKAQGRRALLQTALKPRASPLPAFPEGGAFCVAPVNLKIRDLRREQRLVIGSREEAMHRLTVLYPAKDGEAV